MLDEGEQPVLQLDEGEQPVSKRQKRRNKEKKGSKM
jgi:hypothetical protein